MLASLLNLIPSFQEFMAYPSTTMLNFRERVNGFNRAERYPKFKPTEGIISWQQMPKAFTDQNDKRGNSPANPFRIKHLSLT
jgi:hypothetical protein